LALDFEKYHELVGCVVFFQKIGFCICLGLSMGEPFMCRCKGKSYANWGQWFEPQAHLKMVLSNIAMKGFVVAMLKISKALIPFRWMLGVVHS
jgi:hypothetical protein